MRARPERGLTSRASFLGAARTAPRYRFAAVGGRFPGLVPVGEGGVSVVGELYQVSEAILFGSLLPAEPPELEIGTIELCDGGIVNAMQLQPERVRSNDEVLDISELGGWRSYQRHLANNRSLAGLLGRNPGG